MTGLTAPCPTAFCMARGRLLSRFAKAHVGRPLAEADAERPITETDRPTRPLPKRFDPAMVAVSKVGEILADAIIGWLVDSPG